MHFLSRGFFYSWKEEYTLFRATTGNVQQAYSFLKSTVDLSGREAVMLVEDMAQMSAMKHFEEYWIQFIKAALSMKRARNLHMFHLH